MRLKALVEIYTMHSFAQLQNHIFSKNSRICENFQKKNSEILRNFGASPTPNRAKPPRKHELFKTCQRISQRISQRINIINYQLTARTRGSRGARRTPGTCSPWRRACRCARAWVPPPGATWCRWSPTPNFFFSSQKGSRIETKKKCFIKLAIAVNIRV